MIGRTFLIPNTGPSHNPSLSHLFVALRRPCYWKKTVLVSINTVRLNPDRTCLLGPTDHEFIKNPSFVAYRHAKVYDTLVVEAAISQGEMVEMKAFDERIVALICTGVNTSRGITPRIRSVVSCNSECTKCLLDDQGIATPVI